MVAGQVLAVAHRARRARCRRAGSELQLRLETLEFVLWCARARVEGIDTRLHTGLYNGIQCVHNNL